MTHQLIELLADQEDQRGLRGMKYKDDQPPVDNPQSLAGMNYRSY